MAGTVGYTVILDADSLQFVSSQYETTLGFTGVSGVLVYDVVDENGQKYAFIPGTAKLYINGVRWNKRSAPGTARSYREIQDSEGRYMRIELFTPVGDGAVGVVDCVPAGEIE